MEKRELGLALGFLAGLVDLIPLGIQAFIMGADLSMFILFVFSMWVVILWAISGYLIAESRIKMNSILKGMLVSFFISIPCGFFIIIVWNKPFILLPIGIMALILGGILGFLIDKYGE